MTVAEYFEEFCTLSSLVDFVEQPIKAIMHLLPIATIVDAFLVLLVSNDALKRWRLHNLFLQPFPRHVCHLKHLLFLENVSTVYYLDTAPKTGQTERNL